MSNFMDFSMFVQSLNHTNNKIYKLHYWSLENVIVVTHTTNKHVVTKKQDTYYLII